MFFLLFSVECDEGDQQPEVVTTAEMEAVMGCDLETFAEIDKDAETTAVYEDGIAPLVNDEGCESEEDEPEEDVVEEEAIMNARQASDALENLLKFALKNKNAEMWDSLSSAKMALEAHRLNVSRKQTSIKSFFAKQ